MRKVFALLGLFVAFGVATAYADPVNPVAPPPLFMGCDGQGDCE